MKDTDLLLSIGQQFGTSICKGGQEKCFLAEQAIAVLVTGDPYGNDGLYYLHSDHLGSTSVLSSVNGEQVGSVIRYTPFGGYRGKGGVIQSRIGATLGMNRMMILVSFI